MKEFINFIREQGVVGLAVGFILGGAVSKVVSALVEDLINPIIGIVLGQAGNLSAYTLKLGSTEILYGHLITTIIDFIIIASVVFYGVKWLKLDQLDKKK